MEKSSGKDYLKQGIILNDIFRNPEFFLFFILIALTSPVHLKSAYFPGRQQGAADWSQLSQWEQFQRWTIYCRKILKALKSNKYGKPKSWFLIKEIKKKKAKLNIKSFAFIFSSYSSLY